MARMMTTIGRGAFAILAAAIIAAPARAQQPLKPDEVPKEYEGVGITERLDEEIPLDLPFKDEAGRSVRLSDYFVEGRPVILTLNYYRCPQLCSLTLNGLVDALNELDWSAGQEFEIITVSISPDETAPLADAKKRAYLTQYQRDGADDGWHFLTGGQEAITALAEAVGFNYKRDEATGDFVHSASIMFVTPDGRLSLYMNNVAFQPADMRLALVEASQGEIGSPMEKFLLFTCFQYDPDRGSYTPSVRKLMKSGGLLTIAGIVIAIIVLGRAGPKRGARQAAQAGDSPEVAADGLKS